MMRTHDRRALRRTLSGIAGAIAAVTVLLVSFEYLFTAYDYKTRRLHDEAQLAAKELNRLIQGRRQSWSSPADQLVEVLANFSRHTGVPRSRERLRVLAPDERILIELGGQQGWPSIRQVVPLTDGIATVGYLELVEGIPQVWRRAAWVTGLGVALAVALFLSLRVLSLRALIAREADLEAARQQARAREEELRLVTDAMPVLIGYIDAEQRLGLVNEIAEKWYNRPRDELVGTHLSKVLPPTLYEKILPRARGALAGAELRFEEHATYPDGDTRHIRAHYIPHLGENASVRGFFALVQDITAEKETEARVLQTQKQEALGQLTGGVAHDFNNLLNIILGNLELIQDRVRSDETTSKLLDAALRAVLRGAELTQRLLAFARQQTLAPQTVDVNELAANLAELLRRTLEARVRIETALSSDLWPAMVDPGQLENAIVNLAINARDAMPGGGKLTIETGNAVVDRPLAIGERDVKPGQYVVVTVSDTGTGMSAEVLKHAFDPFFTTKAVGEGSGLGLSMVYGFSKQSGGYVTIDTKAGEGTSVRLYLPRSDAGRQAQPGPQTLESAVLPTGNETVLVVEEAADLRKTAVAMLKGLGYAVEQASDAEAALDILRREVGVDLLFTDVVLAGPLDGIELAHQARLLRPELKVLYTAGHAGREFLRRDRSDRNAELLDKPYRKQELAYRLRALLDEPTPSLRSIAS